MRRLPQLLPSMHGRSPVRTSQSSVPTALLTNDAVLEVPEVPMSSGSYLTVGFSDREEDGERMVWSVRQGKDR